jgi:hypothetical protein
MRRRDVLKTAAGVAVLYAAKSAPATDASELTASEAVRRIQEGQLRAEDYAAQLLKKYQLIKDLHPVTWIDEAKVLER